MSEKYKIARYRATPFKINCPITKKIYGFNGSKDNFIDIKEVEEETYLWLLNSTTAFLDGDLVPIDNEEFKNSLPEEEYEEIKKNTHNRDEIVKILEGNTNTMKKKLQEITAKEEKKFVIDVAKGIKLDSNAKIKFLEEWIGFELDF